MMLPRLCFKVDSLILETIILILVTLCVADEIIAKEILLWVVNEASFIMSSAIAWEFRIANMMSASCRLSDWFVTMLAISVSHEAFSEFVNPSRLWTFFWGALLISVILMFLFEFSVVFLFLYLF
jgi:hypothetical protein